MSSRKHSPVDDLQDLRAVFSADVDLTLPERTVLAVMILHRNGKTGRCDPSTYGMAGETGMHRRTVIRAIGSLEERGLVDADRRNGVRTTYTLHPPTGVTESPVSQSHRCQKVTGPVTESHQTGDTESPERTNTNEERTDGETGTVVSELWAVWLDELGGNGLVPTLTDKRRKRLASLHREQLQDHDDPVALFRKILRRVKASDHHMATRAYQFPESLFRNEERRERWTLDALENGPSANRRSMTPEELRAWDENYE